MKKIKIVFVIGKEDPFFDNNVQLSNSLSERGICNTLYVWQEEAHRPRHWREMVKLYL